MEIEVIRDDDPDSKHNLGQMFVRGKKFGETLEDKDRYLESPGEEKVYGDTSIPRGRWQVILTKSNRFHGKIMPLLVGVAGFDGIRIHGGNTEADVLGCIALGTVRTANGIANCGPVNERLIVLIGEALAADEEVWLTVS